MKKATGNNLEKLAAGLHAASDPSRLRILEVICRGRRVCVSEVAEKLGLSVAIVSHHMNALAKAELVAAERHGKMKCYMPVRSRFMDDIRKMIRKYS